MAKVEFGLIPPFLKGAFQTLKGLGWKTYLKRLGIIVLGIALITALVVWLA